MTPDLATRIRAHVPAELQALPQWVGWRWEDRADKATGELTRTKVPMNPRTLYPAKSTDPSTWTWLRVALRAWQRGDLAGVGFVFKAGGGLVGVDLDGCRDPQADTITPFAQDVVRRLESYCEASPSGKGLHIICRGTLPGTRRQRKAPGANIELYSEGRFFTMTGDVAGPPALPLPDRTTELAHLYADLFPDVPVEGPVVPPAARGPAAPPLLSDEDIRRIAMGAKNGAKFLALHGGDASGYPSESEADLALCSILGFYTQDAAQIERLMDASGLCDAKWRSRPRYRAATIARALRAQNARFGARAA